MGDNSEYGCCPDGETCNGNGGAYTEYDTSTIYSYYTTPSSTTRSYYDPYASTTSSSHAIQTSSSETCEDGWESCGIYWIPEGWTCCPDQQGGCDSSEDRCFLGSNGNYGCCPLSVLQCTGAPGEATTLPDDYSDTDTSSYAYSATSESDTYDYSQHSEASTTGSSPSSTTPGLAGASTVTTSQAFTTPPTRASSSFASQTSVSVPSSFSEAQHVGESNLLAVLGTAIMMASTLIFP